MKLHDIRAIARNLELKTNGLSKSELSHQIQRQEGT